MTEIFHNARRGLLVAATAVLWLAPRALSAEELVVVRGAYRINWEEEASEEKSQMVADAAAQAAREDMERKVILLDLKCPDRSCLKRAVSSQNAADGLLVNVVEQVGGYKIELISLNEKSTGEWTGAFAEMLTEVKRLTRLALAPEEPEPGPPPAPAVERAGRDPKWFWISLGITGALALGTGALEITGYVRWQEFEDKAPEERTGSEKDTLSALRLSEGIALGATAIGALFTAILSVQTDFDRDRGERTTSRFSITPTAARRGGLVQVRGKF